MPANSKIVLSHPTGNTFSRAAVKGILDAGMLQKFYTTIAAFEGDSLSKLSKVPGFKEIERRKYNAELRDYTQKYPWIEAGRFILPKLGLKEMIKHETGKFSVDAVYSSLDKKIASQLDQFIKDGVNALYAYEDGAFYSFSEAKKRGLKCIYDLPIGYWRVQRELLEDEKEKNPEWIKTLNAFKDSKEKLKRKDEEIRMADHIIVASSFTASTLNYFPDQVPPVHVIPYAFPTPVEYRNYTDTTTRKLKFLFVGGLSQRKGIAYLFDAINDLGNEVELTIVGRKPVDDCEALNENLKKHTYIPSLPHTKILELMREQDLLIFPSLFEGFGLVVTEAMSQGTPVITTERTCGPDIIEHDVDGWIIQAGSSKSLKTQINKLIENPDQLISAGKAALKKAKDRSWEIYSKEIGDEIVRIFK